MSDATLPSPRSSSAAPAPGEANQSDLSTGEVESDTSIIESSEAGSKDESIEGRPENKQKRKRTSPKDQTILEAEYAQNPKPNKAARAIIVEKVDLNEKEVQIWFQNRRQINRRKSRPLLPHEIVAYGLGGMAALSSGSATPMIRSSSQSMDEPAIKFEQEVSSSQEQDMANSQGGEIPAVYQVEECVQVASPEAVKLVEDSQASLPSTVATLTTQSSPEASSFPASSCATSQTAKKSFSSAPGYLSNRWNAVSSSFSTPSSSQVAPFITPSLSQSIIPASCPERIGSSGNYTPSSRIRLSMSLDGKAKLISSDPSPPRVQSVRPLSSRAGFPKRRMGGLQRSQSAYSFVPLARNALASASFAPRLTSGRSRDARSWEFCCDPDVRDELTAQAENESSGSALAAIGLMRSTSKTALKSNSNKRNAPSTKPDSSNHGKKPKLGRATSSLARLQSTGKQSPMAVESSKSKHHIMGSPSGDSDKENWVPGENGANARRRPLPTARVEKPCHSKVILGDNHRIPTHAFNLGGPKNKPRKSAFAEPKVYEDQENKGDVGEDVEKFMRGEVSPSKKGDLDCIQGLLSLSQGNWR